MAVRWGSTLQAPECCRNISFLHASKDYCTGSPSSVHKENHRKFQHCFAYYELFLDFLWEIQHKYSTEICTIVQYRTINCTYINLRILLFFSVWPGLNSWPFYMVLWLLVCSVLFSYIKRSKAGDCVQSQLTNLRPHRRTAHRFTCHESAKSLRRGHSLIFSPRHGHCVVFCGKFFWKCLVLGNLTCAQDQTLSKKFPTKHNAMPMTRGKDKRMTSP